jgi:hypothetical protein
MNENNDSGSGASSSGGTSASSHNNVSGASGGGLTYSSSNPDYSGLDSPTARIAAQEVEARDKRPHIVTAFDQIRRKQEPQTLTERIAMQTVDAADNFAGLLDDREGRSLSEWIDAFPPEKIRAMKKQAYDNAVASVQAEQRNRRG